MKEINLSYSGITFSFLKGVAMATGLATGPDANYFRLHVNQYNTVETITCLSRKVTQFTTFNKF